MSNPLIRTVGGFDLRKRDSKWVKPKPKMRLLEVGAGGGYYTKHVRDRLDMDSVYVVLDLQAQRVQKLVDRNESPAKRVDGVSANGNLLPFADETFDCVFYSYSLEEMPEYVPSLSESQRVLRPDGELVLFIWRPLARGPKLRHILDLVGEQYERVWIQMGLQNIRVRARQS